MNEPRLIPNANPTIKRANINGEIFELDSSRDAVLQILEGMGEMKQEQIIFQNTVRQELTQHVAEAGEKFEQIDQDITDLGKSVSDGKALVASAITGKGVATAADATFATMAGNVSKISTSSTGMSLTYLGDIGVYHGADTSVYSGYMAYIVLKVSYYNFGGNITVTNGYVSTFSFYGFDAGDSVYTSISHYIQAYNTGPVTMKAQMPSGFRVYGITFNRPT